MDKTLKKLLEIMPKAELHLHIEGSLEPELLFSLAERNQITLPYASVKDLKKAYAFGNLQDFLNIYYQGMSVLITEEDFYDLTWAYLKRGQAQNLRHTEIFYDPQGHLERGIPFDVPIKGISRALKDGKEKLGISSRLILSFLRHLSEEKGFEALEMALPYKELITGVGLDSSEQGHPPQKFARLFAKCKDLGFKRTAHAGEEGPPEYVWEALNLIEVERIDHGNRCLEDPLLVEEIKRRNLTLTVCPLSNLKLQVVKNLKDHPLETMLDLGLKATVNSDDPAYFGGYIQDNFFALAELEKLKREHVYTLARNAFSGSWLEEEEKQRYLEDLAALFV